jgi:hypothetical protein
VRPGDYKPAGRASKAILAKRTGRLGGTARYKRPVPESCQVNGVRELNRFRRSGFRNSKLPIGNVHRDFEAKTDLGSSRGLPFHGVHRDYSCL